MRTEQLNSGLFLQPRRLSANGIYYRIIHSFQASGLTAEHRRFTLSRERWTTYVAIQGELANG